MSHDDRPAIEKILQDPEVMIAYEGPFSEQEVTGWIDKQLQHYQNDHIGLWLVIEKASGQAIGQCGLTWQDVKGEAVLEIGYLFQKNFWHHGFATEAAQACKDYAFATLNAASCVCCGERDVKNERMLFSI